MKKIVLLCFFFCYSLSISQTTVTAVLDTFQRTSPIIGINGNANFNIANWTVPQFVDSFQQMNPAILRYPGGLNANYWDWQTGWFQSGVTLPVCAPGINPPITSRPEECKIGLDSCAAKMLYVINFYNSTLSYQLQGIQHIHDIGIPLQYIEFGNEHNLTCEPIPPGTYAQRSKQYADSIKFYHPNSKICLVGGDIPGSNPHWIDSISVYSPNFDAFAFHMYPGANTSDGIFNITRALAVPFTYVQQRYNASHFSLYPTPKEVWVTEFNLSEPLSGAPLTITDSWTHSLYILTFIHNMLVNKNLTMFVQFAATGNNEFDCVDPFTKKVTANGVAMKLIDDIAKGSDSCRQMLFSPYETQSYGTTTFPKIIGWKFWNSTTSKAILVNISNTTYTADISTCIPINSLFTQYYADTLLNINGISSLSTTSGTTGNALTLIPYSVTQITVVTQVPSFIITASSDSGGTIFPSGNVMVDSGSNQSFHMSSKAGYHIDSVIIDGSYVGTDSVYTFINVTSNHAINAVFATNTDTVMQIAFAAKWNLISVPLCVANNSKSALFPTATSNAYAYQGTYAQKDTLISGRGYWLKFASAETLQMTGTMKTTDTIQITAGWNLIGTISKPLSVASVVQIPDRIISSGYFDYSSGYFKADTLRPARGYWVKASADGIIVVHAK